MEVLEDFQAFFNFLKKTFEEKGFFKKSSKDLLNFISDGMHVQKKMPIVTSDNSKAYLEYKTSIFKRLDLTSRGLRFSMSFQELTSELDLKKINQS